VTQRLYTPSAANDTFAYDPPDHPMLSNRRVNVSFTWPESFTYDGAPPLTQTMQNGQMITYRYDIPGKKRTVTSPGSCAITEHTDFPTRMDHIDDARSASSVVHSPTILQQRVRPQLPQRHDIHVRLQRAQQTTGMGIGTPPPAGFS
jgi:hypothetical protein